MEGVQIAIPRGKNRSRTVPLRRVLLVLAWSVVIPAAASGQNTGQAGDPLHIAVFTPTSEGNTYWPEVHRVMSDAQAALNVVLTIHEFDVGDRFDKVDQGIRILRTEPVPDGAIFSVAYGQAEPLMDTAEELGIPFFLHGPLFPEELTSMGGGPRRTYAHWIGYFHEDEEEKGYLLARELISAAATTNEHGPEKGRLRFCGSIRWTSFSWTSAWPVMSTG